MAILKSERGLAAKRRKTWMESVPTSDLLTRSFNSSGDVEKGVVAKKDCSREI